MQRRNKLDVVRSFDTNPMYKKIPKALRVSVYLKLSLVTNQIVEVEKQLSRTFRDCQDFFHESSPFLSSLSEKLVALEGKAATPGISAQKFALVTEDYHQIKLFFKTLMAHLEETCDEMEATLKTRKYVCYLSLLIFDPEVLAFDATVGWGPLRDENVFSFLDDYIAAHPLPNLDLLSPKGRKAAESILKLISDTRRDIASLKASLAVLKTLEQGVSSKYMDAFIRLGALYKAGLISLSATGKLVMGPPSSYRPSLEDGLGDEVSLPPLPASLGAARAAARVATTAATPTALVAEEAAEEPPAAASVEEEAPAAFQASPTSEEYRRLASLLEVAEAHSRFTFTPAKAAFQNALYYAGVLNALLSEFKGELFESTQLASLQQDIGTAAFYAYEQLLTAIVLEKQKPETPAEIFETLEHRLMRRFLKGDLAHQAEVRGIISVIKELEGMGNAVKDLSRAFPVPNLLQHTLQLISGGDSPAPLGEQTDTMVRGQAALRGFFTLLYSCCLHKKPIPSDHKAMFARAAGKPPKPPSSGMGGGAAAAASKAVTGGGGGGGVAAAAAAASEVVRGGGSGGAPLPSPLQL